MVCLVERTGGSVAASKASVGGEGGGVRELSVGGGGGGLKSTI